MSSVWLCFLMLVVYWIVLVVVWLRGVDCVSFGWGKKLGRQTPHAPHAPLNTHTNTNYPRLLLLSQPWHMWPPSHKIKCLPARGTLAPLEVWARTPHIRGVPVYCLEPEGGHEDGPESRLGDEEERRLRQAKDKTTQIRLTICKHSTLYLEINSHKNSWAPESHVFTPLCRCPPRCQSRWRCRCRCRCRFHSRIILLLSRTKSRFPNYREEDGKLEERS